MDSIKNISPRTLIVFSAVLGVSLVISTIIGGAIFYRVRSNENSLSVTGSAKTTIVSDNVKWVGSFSRVASPQNLKSGYEAMARDLAVVKKFYKDQGITDEQINISQIYMEQDWSKQNAGAGERDYILRQNIEVNSTDVQKIQDLAKNISPIVSQGVLFNTQSLEFYYSKLPELRVSLLSEAVKDAKARAAKLAESTGKEVGSLKSASSGVVQLLPKNSIEVSDYGAYDTSSVEKDVMITVKANFTLK